MKFHQENDSERLDSLKAMLALIEATQNHMKQVNDYYREHGTVKGCPGVSPDAVEIMDREAEEGSPSEKQPFSSYTLLQDYYEIRRLKREIKALENSMDQFVGWTFPGGKARISVERNRLQLEFHKVIGPVKQIVLKQNGFSRGESGMIWERRLERTAIRAAARINFVRPIEGISPEKLQPYVSNKRGMER